MRERLVGWLRSSPAPEAFALLLLTLPLSVPALGSFFTFDDLQNLNYYQSRPWTSLFSNLVVFTSLRRPLGALFYLPVYHLFGMNPLPLYLIGAGLFYLNLGLFHRLVFRLTASRATALLALAVAGFHPHLHNVLYNFGAVYELSCFAALLGALHCHLNLLESGRAKWRWWTLGLFLVGLNAKETAVVLPALLVCHEGLYRFLWTERRGSVAAAFWRIAPPAAIAVPYTLAKTLGDEALWRDNPLYRLQWDLTFYRNLAAYFTELSYATFHFSTAETTAAVVALPAAALLLKNRHMLFGLAFSFLTLAPVLALPRVWGLFLYMPLAGVALYLASLATGLADLAAGWARPATRAKLASWAPAWRWAGVLLTVGLMLRVSLPSFAAAREFNYFGKTSPWRAFSKQLYRIHPTIEAGTILGFENPPFALDQPDRWCLHFLVWLKYENPDLRVYRLPVERDRFLAAAGRAPARYFVWDQGRLLERPLEELAANGPN